MGSGWETDSTKEIYRTPCACGMGSIITYEIELSSTKPPLRFKTEKETEVNCKNQNCPSKK